MKYPLSLSSAAVLTMLALNSDRVEAGQHPKIPHAYEAEEHAHRVYHEKKNDPNHQRKKNRERAKRYKEYLG